MPIFKAIQSELSGAYNNWETCVNEHLVRVNVARMALQGGEDYHTMILQSELSQGFPYITDLHTLMSRYEANRDRYPTYESFYLNIVDCFNSLLEKQD